MAAAEPYIEREPPRDDWGVLACAECNRPLCNVDDFGSEGGD